MFFRLSTTSVSVADRINELEKQQKYSYLDPEKKHKVPDPTLKAIQKKALLSFYERHHSNNKTNTWRSEPQLVKSKPALAPVPQSPPKLQLPSRRASCASDYASAICKRSSLTSVRDVKENKITPRHQHSNSCGSLSTDLIGPVIVGPSISLDDWVPERPPERPPKNPHLRAAFPELFQEQRVPSPDLPPPSPPTVQGDEYSNNDEPLPPPPPELNSDWQQGEKFKQTTHQTPRPQVGTNDRNGARSPGRDVPFVQNYELERGILRYSSVRSTVRPLDISQAERLRNKASQMLDHQKNHDNRSLGRYPMKHLQNGVGVITNGFGEQYRGEAVRAQLVHVKEDSSRKMNSQDIPGGKRNNGVEMFKEVPPPLQPRQKINSSMRARNADGKTSYGARMVSARDVKDINGVSYDS